MGDANSSLSIEQERSEHGPQIEHLIDVAFGPGRFAKTAERLREGNTAIAKLCLVAFENSTMRASVRFWPIRIGVAPAVLLGPLAVDPDHRGKNIGVRLMETGLTRAEDGGHRIVLLVGDEPYYARVGFQKVPAGSMIMPGPVDPERLLANALVDGALDGVEGRIAAAFDLD